MLTRRGLLVTGGVVAAAAMVAACEPGQGDPSFDPSDWTSVRAQFTLDPEIANFTTFVFASHPASVRSAIARHRDALDRDAYGYLHDNQVPLDEAAARAAAHYLGTVPELLAFTDSTTMGLGLLYSGLRLDPDDEILTTEHDFYATHESLRLRAVRDGARIQRVRLYDEPESADVDQMTRRLLAAVTPRTRIVAVTWVHSGTGVKLPVRRIADALAEVNAQRPENEHALLCVDGVHGVGIEAETVDDLGCHFLVSGAHKWLFGPRGTGFIWGRPAAWRRVTPIIPTFVGASNGPPGPYATPGGYHTFEHRWALAEAFDFHSAIGRTRVTERSHALAGALKDGLATVDSVRVRTPRDPALSAGIVCCEVDGASPARAAEALRGAGVLTSPTPYTPSYLRLGPSILTSESDVDKAVAAIRALSRHA